MRYKKEDSQDRDKGISDHYFLIGALLFGMIFLAGLQIYYFPHGDFADFATGQAVAGEEPLPPGLPAEEIPDIETNIALPQEEPALPGEPDITLPGEDDITLPGTDGTAATAAGSGAASAPSYYSGGSGKRGRGKTQYAYQKPADPILPVQPEPPKAPPPTQYIPIKEAPLNIVESKPEQKTETSLNDKAEQPQAKSGFPILAVAAIALAVAAGAALAVFFVYSKKKEEKLITGISDYIRRYRQQGYNDMMIKKQLLNYYDTHRVEKAYKRLEEEIFNVRPQPQFRVSNYMGR